MDVGRHLADGRWLVFDLLGHVYRVPAGGGEAEPLTQNSGIAINYHPRYSPDGRQIAFISDRAGQENLWVMNADGSDPRPVALADDARHAEPAWSPDGRFIYVTKREATPSGFYRTNDVIWKYPREGGPGAEVVRIAASGATTPSRVWSAAVWMGDDRVQWPSPAADGRYLYFGSSLFAGDDRRLRRIDLVSGEVTDVTESKARYLTCCGRPAYPMRMGEVAPEISPDGRWLAFARKIPAAVTSYRGHEYVGRTALWLRDLRTGEERVLVDPITPSTADWHPSWTTRALPGYAWAEDGRSLVLSQGGKLRRVWVEDGRVETIPFRAHVRRTLSEAARRRVRLDDDSMTVRAPRWPASSPDGRRLVFEAVGQLWIMELPDDAPRPLTGGAAPGVVELTPSWSPDGRSIAYTTWSDEEGGHVWRIPAEGGPPRRVTTEPGTYLFPLWEPDGRTLLVNRWPPEATRTLDTNGWELARVPAAGGAAAPVGRAGVLVTALGPAGRLYLGRPGSDGSVIVSRRPDGAEPREHALVTAGPVTAIPSPDGRWLAIQHRRDIYLAALAGGVQPDTRAAIALDGPAVRRLTRGGALHPRWRDAGTLEFVIGNRYVAHDAASGRADTFRIALRLPRAVARGSIALTGARIVTLAGDGVIEAGTVLVRDGRIACIGTCATEDADHVVDVRGKTIIPGFVDVHAHHLGVLEQPIITPQSSGSARYLAYGVTTVHDPAANAASFTVGEMIEAGRMTGPRTFSAGDPLTCGAWSMVPQIDSYADAAALVDYYADLGALSLKDYKQCTRTQRIWLAEAARQRGVTLTSEGSDLFYLLGLLMDGHTGWEHPIQAAPIHSDVATFVGQARGHYSPQLMLTDYPLGNAIEYWLGQQDVLAERKLRYWTPWQELATRRTFVKKPMREYVFPLVAAGAVDIRRAGGYVAIGAHGEQKGQDTHWEVWSYGTAATPLEALEAASLGGAHFLGLDDEIGSLAAGKLADLVVLEANPLEDLRATDNIVYVMKAGRLYRADTLEELWPQRRPYGVRPWSVEDALRTDARPLDYWDRVRKATQDEPGHGGKQ